MSADRSHPAADPPAHHLAAPAAAPHVLIIGAGIGGLCLASGLKRSGIGVTVYERDSSAQARAQGYRLSLSADGVSALRACLPEPLFALCAATAIRPATRLVVMDHQLHPRFGKPLPPPVPADSAFGVNRLTLREILLAGLDGAVRFGAGFQRLERLGDGRVRAHLAGGRTAVGDLLVGADGTDSAVRALLAPEARLDHLGWFIYGRTPILADTLTWAPEVLVDSFNRMSAPDGVGLAVVTCRTREPCGRAAARLAPGVRLTEQPDYLAWMVDGWSAPDAPAPGADPAALHRLARGLLQGWPAPVRRIVDQAEVAATFLVRLRSARPVEPWRAAGVTLLGDAIHTMSPGRGEGANRALCDAALLRRALAEVASGGLPLAVAVARYEREMLRAGFEAVAASLHRPFLPRSRPATRTGRPDR